MSDFFSFDNVPKLFPSWKDPSFKVAFSNKIYFKFANDKLPDYSGIGVDVVADGDQMKCETTKFNTEVVDFCSHAPALPFLPLKKGALNSSLKKSVSRKEIFEKFCIKLTAARSHINKKTGTKYRDKVLSLCDQIKRMETSDELSAVDIPISVKNLVEDFPQNIPITDADLTYMGGCLASSSREDGSTFLLHPVGKKLDTLAFTSIEEYLHSHKHFQPVKIKDYNSKFGVPIRQITCDFHGYCYVRLDRKCFLVNFEDFSNCESLCCAKGPLLSHIAGSPYNPYECIATYKNEKIELIDVSQSRTLWHLEKFELMDKFEMSLSSLCSFGSHPASFLLLNENTIFIFDVRLKKNQGRQLFSCQNFTSFHEEKFFNTQRLESNPFQHLIASSDYLYVCDERYPSKNVLKWNHVLGGSPMYCDSTTFHNNDTFSDMVTVLGCQIPTNMGAFYMRSSLSKIQPISLCNPMLLSCPSDWADTLKFHCIDVDDDVVQRLSCQLRGVSVVHHPYKTGFTAFQLTSNGDIFYQDFEKNNEEVQEKTFRVCTGCTFVPPETILPHVSSWLNVKKKEKETPKSAILCRKFVDLKDYLDAVKGPHPCCHLISEASSDAVSEASGGKCLTCGLDDPECRKLRKAFDDPLQLRQTEINKLILSKFDVSDLPNYDDTYSKKLLKCWISDTENTDDNVAETTVRNLETQLSNSENTFLGEPSLYPPMASSTPVVKPEKAPNPLFQNIHFEDMWSEFQFPSQESFDSVVPPSQDVRPLIGETLRTKKTKVHLVKNTAGF